MHGGSSVLAVSVMIFAADGAGVGNVASSGTGIWLSVTLTAKANGLPTVGVPPITPEGVSVIPGGRGPLPGASVHVYGGTPPLTCIWTGGYAAPTLEVRIVGVTTFSWLGATLIPSETCALPPR